MVIPRQPSIEIYAPFHKYRKLRMQAAYLFLVVLLFLARSSDFGFLMGIPVIFLGEAIRLWSHGYILKARELATGGPYAFVRNPLYVGNFLIGLGFCLIVWHPVVMAIYIAGFITVYWITVKGEEQRLAFQFKEEYANYVKHVPRFIPRLFPYSKLSQSQFDFARAFKHGEQIAIFAIINTILFLYLRQEIFQEGKAWSSPELVKWYTFFLVNTSLQIGVFLHRRYKKEI